MEEYIDTLVLDNGSDELFRLGPALGYLAHLPPPSPFRDRQKIDIYSNYSIGIICHIDHTFYGILIEDRQ